MSPSEHPITISNKSTIIPWKEEARYNVPRSDWVFLKEKIKRIKSPQLLWYTIGSVLLGIAGSSGLTAILCKNSWIGLIFAITLTGGIFSLLLAKEQRKTIVNSQRDALIEMQRIEDKHEGEVTSAFRKLRKDIDQLAIKEQSKENSEEKND